MTKVKICGITSIDDALFAARQGADFIGLVFAPSLRRINVDLGKAISGAVHAGKPGTSIAGVFVNEAIEEVNRIADNVGLDYVQLSGDESWEYCAETNRPVIKAIHITNGTSASRILAEIKNGLRHMGDTARFLLDSKVGPAYGGTGCTFDWRIAAETSAKFPVIVAGGLNPENVNTVIHQCRPWGVDTASGVETGGMKDILKIKAFIDAAKTTTIAEKTGITCYFIEYGGKNDVHRDIS